MSSCDRTLRAISASRAVLMSMAQAAMRLFKGVGSKVERAKHQPHVQQGIAASEALCHISEQAWRALACCCRGCHVEGCQSLWLPDP